MNSKTEQNRSYEALQNRTRYFVAPKWSCLPAYGPRQCESDLVGGCWHTARGHLCPFGAVFYLARLVRFWLLAGFDPLSVVSVGFWSISSPSSVPRLGFDPFWVKFLGLQPINLRKIAKFDANRKFGANRSPHKPASPTSCIFVHQIPTLDHGPPTTRLAVLGRLGPTWAIPCLERTQTGPRNRSQIWIQSGWIL